MNETIASNIHQIRLVLESFDKKDFDWMTSFHQSSGFPNGCCGDATDLLGLYLSKNHGIESIYVCGSGLGDNPDQSHAWLLCGEYIIDITADQFNDKGYNLPPVIITSNSEFHNCFDETTSYPFAADSLESTGIPNILVKTLNACKNLTL